MKKVVLAHILNPLSKGRCQFIQNGALILKFTKNKWVIDEIGKSSNLASKIDGVVIDLSDKVIMPTFFDMHFHWVQDDVREMPKASLLEWLEKYTFPTEDKFKNRTYARKKAKSFFKKLISTGTLGGAVYSSIHEHALHYAMEEALGDFIIGNVQMTINSPKNLTQKSSEAIALTKKLSKKYREKYALTPRFAIATDPVTMKESAKIAKKNKSFIQTHLSENHGEIEFVNSLYKNEMKGFSHIKNYTDIYKKVGILGAKTIMGHGIHLSPQELKTLSLTNTAIAHCPTSNAPIKEKGLGSGLFDFKKVTRYKIQWALASDIGGGPFLSMFDVMRSFVDQNQKKKIKATYMEALYRSTLAGAEILNLAKSKGNLVKGKEANFLAVEAPKLTKNTSAEEVLAKIIKPYKKNRQVYDNLCTDVFYQGECVFKK
jgi:guanine deaminase